MPYVYVMKTDYNGVIHYEVVNVDDAETYYMNKRDRVYAFDYRRFNDKLPVVALMDGREPLVLEYSEDLNLEIIIHRLGGIPATVCRNEAEIYVRDLAKPGNFTIQRTVNLTADNLASTDLIHEDALVIFRRDAQKKRAGVVHLIGEFKNPGPYPLLSKTETLSDILQRVNGLTVLSNPYSLYIRRNGLPKQIPVELKSESPLLFEGEYFLADGDSIFISANNNTVEIAGMVFNPTIVSYVEGYTWKDYLNAAGGGQDSADIRKSYIVYPNGNASKTRRGLFASCKVVPGSKLVVPKKPYKPPREKPAFDYKEFTAVITRTMTMLLTAIIITDKVK